MLYQIIELIIKKIFVTPWRQENKNLLHQLKRKFIILNNWIHESYKLKITKFS